MEDKAIDSPIYKDFYLPESGEVIYEIDLFKDYLVLYLKRVSESFIKIIQLNGDERYVVKIPSSVVYSSNQ